MLAQKFFPSLSFKSGLKFCTKKSMFPTTKNPCFARESATQTRFLTYKHGGWRVDGTVKTTHIQVSDLVFRIIAPDEWQNYYVRLFALVIIDIFNFYSMFSIELSSHSLSYVQKLVQISRENSNLDNKTFTNSKIYASLAFVFILLHLDMALCIYEFIFQCLSIYKQDQK